MTKSNTTSGDKGKADFQDFLVMCWNLKWWILLSTAVALIISFCYVSMKNPVYEQTSWIMMNKPDGSNSDLSLIAEITGNSTSKKVDNEVFILKSPSMMSKVVAKLGLNTRYFHYEPPVQTSTCSGPKLFDFKKVEMYKDTPVWLVVTSDTELGKLSGLKIEFKNIDGATYSVKSLEVDGEEYELERKSFAYGDTIAIGFSNAVISRSLTGEMEAGDRYLCTWNTAQATAKSFLNNLTVETNGEGNSIADVITLSYKDPVPERASNILNTLVSRANLEYRQYNGLSASKTIGFIDNRLDDIASQLGAAENEYSTYQSSRSLVDLESQSRLQLNSDMQYQNQQTEVNMQIKILEMVSDMIEKDSQGEHRVIPANIGISDNGLNSIISNYNTMVAERNRLASNSSASNPRVVNLNSQLDDARNTILMTISSLKDVYQLRSNELSAIVNESKRTISTLPKEQFQLQQISRKVDVIEPLYLLLQQKREEAQIALYSETDNFRVIEPAFGTGKPISPKKTKIYILAFILGLVFPVAYTYLRKALRFKVETKKDVTDAVGVPVLTVLPEVDCKKGYPLICDTADENLSEAFRKLRSGIQYLPGVKVIQITSSIPEEGKSFVAANLALSIAQTQKSVVLVGMDLRKPALAKIFPDVKPDLANSVVGYLLEKTVNPADLIQKTGICPNLDLVISGAVPPNPSELLTLGRLKELIAWLKSKYDYVIIDSAPYFNVTDSFLVAQNVDAVLYCVRAGHTDLKMLPEINDILTNEITPIAKPYTVLNAAQMKSNRYSYHYKYGYGYSLKR